LALSHGHAVAGVAPPPPPAIGSGSNSATANGWLIGAHAGYGWQKDSVVFGFETDLQGTDLHSSMHGGLTYPAIVTPPPGDFARTSASVDWYGTLRGRLGIANGPWLFYGTGGLAYGDVGLRSYFNTVGLLTAARTSDLRTGWVGGVGVEYWWRPNASFTLSYQYVDLGTLSLLSATSSGGIAVGQTASVHAQFQAVMAGFSVRFAPTSSASPWAGGYGGVHAGGVWGDDTNANYTSSLLPR
jgi:outer membrane immunogenic protein